MSITPNDKLARFVFNSNHIRANGTVKHQAFLPAKDGDTSVFCITGLTHADVWNIADSYVVPVRLKPVKGSAEIISNDALEHNLTVTLSEPPPKHANISNWPGGLQPTDEDKARRKQIAQRLAEIANWIPK